MQAGELGTGVVLGYRCCRCDWQVGARNDGEDGQVELLAARRFVVGVARRRRRRFPAAYRSASCLTLTHHNLLSNM